MVKKHVKITAIWIFTVQACIKDVLSINYKINSYKMSMEIDVKKQ